MTLTVFDLILLLTIFLAVAFGFAMGLIQAIGALVGVVLGSWLAGLYYIPFGEWLSQYIGGSVMVGRAIGFIVLFAIINRFIGLIFYALDRLFHLISFIPFLKSINHILGGILGFIEGALGLGLILYFLSKFEISPWLTTVLGESVIGQWLIDIGTLLSPLLPEIIQQLKTVI